MSLRLIELVTEEDTDVDCHGLLEDEPVMGVWQEQLDGQRTLVRVLVDAEHSEHILDLIEDRFSGAEGFRLMVFPIEATVPRPQANRKEAESESDDSEQEQPPNHDRVSREELYQDALENARTTPTYLALVGLSTLVACIGLVRDDVAVIIGAMVIAPLLGPNVALALGTTLGDLSLMYEALKASAAGLLAAVLIAIALGLVLEAQPEIPAIASRTDVSLQQIVLGLAAGSAGAVAFTRAVPAALVGVMVAVALLPPLAVAGMMLGSGHLFEAYRAMLLVLTNIVALNLAAILTFAARGIRPRNWWETDRAKRATRTAVGLWVALLAVLVATVLLSTKT